MTNSRIVDRGDGPKIEGTRITVYAIYEYANRGRTREWIASMLNLSSQQVQAALDYIAEHRAEIASEFEKIQQRTERGNPPEAEAKLAEARRKLLDQVSQHQVAANAEDHGRQ